jgi:hypothetical protein
LPGIPDMKHCTRCGSRLETQKKPEAVTSQATTDIETTETAFLANARLGLNRWWRWVVGSILILVIWQGIGYRERILLPSPRAGRANVCRSR